jgi:hypothetical protein
MNRLVTVAVLLGLAACAASPLRDARRMGLVREGLLRAETAEWVHLSVQVHDDAPQTLPGREVLQVPLMPELDAAALKSVVVATVQQVGKELGVAIFAADMATGTGDLPARFRTLAEAEVPSALSLTVHVGWCPDGDGWSACVRSPDTAIGYGPPGIEGFLYSRFRFKTDVAIARRVRSVHKTFVYEIDPGGAHLDRGFIGEGNTVQAQAEDAIRQAVDAWVTVARGRRGRRYRDAATADVSPADVSPADASTAD